MLGGLSHRCEVIGAWAHCSGRWMEVGCALSDFHVMKLEREGGETRRDSGK